MGLRFRPVYVSSRNTYILSLTPRVAVPATNLQGTQYSWLTSLLYIAQLAFQPLSSFVLVRFPIKYWILLNLFGCTFLLSFTPTGQLTTL